MGRKNSVMILGMLLLGMCTLANSQKLECISSEFVAGLPGSGRTIPALLVGELPEGFPAIALPHSALTQKA